MREKEGGDEMIALITRVSEATEVAAQDGSYLELFDTSVQAHDVEVSSIAFPQSMYGTTVARRPARHCDISTVAPAAIVFRLTRRKKQKKVVMTQVVTSEEDFKLAFVTGGRLWHMREKEGGDETIALITRVSQATEAAAQVGTYLELYDSTEMLNEDVSSLKGFRENVAAALETSVAKAAALDVTLSQKYGKGVLLGISVVFYDEKRNPRVEIDGLVLFADTSTLACVEAKTRLHADDIAKMAETRTVLVAILNNPTKYSSMPDSVLERIALRGLTIVTVAGTGLCEDGVAAMCTGSGIHLLQPSGSGYACTLASDVAAVVTARALASPIGEIIDSCKAST